MKIVIVNISSGKIYVLVHFAGIINRETLPSFCAVARLLWHCHCMHCACECIVNYIAIAPHRHCTYGSKAAAEKDRCDVASLVDMASR